VSVLRPVTASLVASVAVVGVIDTGAAALSKLALADAMEQTAHAAIRATDGMPTTRQTAGTAYSAAVVEGRNHDLTVEEEGFTIYPDGGVRLTVTKTAPTLLLGRLPVLRDLAVLQDTASVAAPRIP
jgi:hypothetical protein